MAQLAAAVVRIKASAKGGSASGGQNPKFKVSEMVERLKNPEKIIQVWFPVRMGDGQEKIFEGYRVQYNSARGPYKGGIRFHPDVSLMKLKPSLF